MSSDVAVIFHGIGKPQRALEPGESPYWVSAAQSEEILRKIAAMPAADRPVITFDDGNLSDYSIGFDLLMRHGLVGRFFVLTGRLGQDGSLDAQMLREMAGAGMVIGSHGIDHVDWAKIPDAQLEDEITTSRDVLQDITGQPVTEAGIPFGSYRGRVLRALRAAGYRVAWTSDRGRHAPDGFLRPRTSFAGAMTDAQIAAVLRGELPPKARLRRTIGMLRKRL